MVERTEAEKTAIVNKVVDTLGAEALALRHVPEHRQAGKALLEYLLSGDEESFIRLYDILREA